nr:unnamed protein product [Callosobruchus analis]
MPKAQRTLSVSDVQANT